MRGIAGGGWNPAGVSTYNSNQGNRGNLKSTPTDRTQAKEWAIWLKMQASSLSRTPFLFFYINNNNNNNFNFSFNNNNNLNYKILHFNIINKIQFS